jgi:LPXTG-motif cell wall-anchored protein
VRTLVQHRVNLSSFLFSVAQSKAAVFLVIIVFGLVPTFFSAPPVFACSCVELVPPSEAYEESDAVFAGTVHDIEHGTGIYRIYFDAERAWKGISETPLMATTPDNDGLCGYDFQEGVEYLVYAYGKESLSAHICSRTQQLSTANEDLAYLGTGYVPVQGQPIIKTTPEASEQNYALPFIGIGAAIAGAIAFLTLRKRRR